MPTQQSFRHLAIAGFLAVVASACGVGADGPEADGIESHIKKKRPGQLVVSVPLSLDRSTVQPGQTVTGSVTFENIGGAPVAVQQVVIAGRPPNGTRAGGPFEDFAPTLTSITVQAGASVTLVASRTFSATDPSGQWESFATWQDANGNWIDGPAVFFTVDAQSPTQGGGLEIAVPLSLSKTNLVPGDTLEGRVTLKNTSASAISFQRLVIAGRPPGGTKANGPYEDLAPALGPTTVQPGASVTVNASRTFSASDTAGEWEFYSTYQDVSGGWNDGASVFVTFSNSDSTVPVPPTPTPSGLRVSGNKILDASGQPVRLLGVNRAGAEYACIQGWGIFEGPTDNASIQAMKGWHINTVRLPMNETCWLGINGAPAAYSGANYRQAIVDYVNRLTSNGIAVVLDLHWTAPGSERATDQDPMPNRDHSPTFWSQVANTFKGNPAVAFDLFNEPHPDNNSDSYEAWRCWRDGGSCSGLPFQVAGMQELVDAVRNTGATNLILLSGVQYAARLTGWKQWKPNDPLNNLAPSWHIYNFSWCANQTCWDNEVAPLMQSYPVVLGELGQSDCGGWFITSLMNWMDARGGSYLGWTWNNWGSTCNGPSLIIDDAGTPNGTYGKTFRDHLLKVNP